MASGKGERNAKPFKRKSLGPKRDTQKRKPKQKKVDTEGQNKVIAIKSKKKNEVVRLASPSQQLEYFVDQFQSANGVKLSSLELESITENCIVKLPLGLDQDASNLGEHMKIAFGSSWEEELCEAQLEEGKVEPGSPAVLIFSAAALRSLDLLRGLHSLTRKCHAAKLFSKHMKVENQVTLLKSRVNIASGTPSRIKKLIEMEALGLSRLEVIVLDMQMDVKGFSLFTLTQVRDELWDLYKTYFHQRLLQGKLRICLYGPIPVSAEKKNDETERSDN
ncbi:unnamed protein product [Rhodiola kirilowii]